MTSKITSSLAALNPFSNSHVKNDKPPAKIAVIGAGWWSQGWHLPQLEANPNAELVAIIEIQDNPSTKLAELESKNQLAERYPNAEMLTDYEKDLLQNDELLAQLDGVLVATPHHTHHEIGTKLLKVAKKRHEKGDKPLNIMMEKPMTANIKQAKELHETAQEYKKMGGEGIFMVNHSANYRENAKVARNVIYDQNSLGRITHITAFFASPLMSIFDDPDMKGWNEPHDAGMIANGFCWGQIAHMLGYIYHICPTIIPTKVYCNMYWSLKTGADIAHAATITCTDTSDEDNNNIVFSLSGTSLLPDTSGDSAGGGKQVRIQIYGNKGALLYCGDDSDPKSGHMELRRQDGTVEKPAGDKFYFENITQGGVGTESLQNFIAACQQETVYDGAGTLLGLRTVQTIHAMYRSAKSQQPEEVEYTDVKY